MATQKSLTSYLLRLQNIPHYYGDVVRALFLIAAVLSLVAIPLFGGLFPFSSLAQVSCALLLVLLAGLTNPHSKMVLVYDTVASGLGVLLLEMAAINLYAIDSMELFFARETAALALLFAFYYSVKTLRAMSLGRLGKAERPWEFENVPNNKK